MKRCSDGRVRCFGYKDGQTQYADYHDNEWGIETHDERMLFEMLILEGAQAGLSWETILKKREGYRRAFYHFDPIKVAAMSDQELEDLCHNPAIIRNRLKIYAARTNAKVFLEIQRDYQSFDRYIWAYVGGYPQINHFRHFEELPAQTEVSQIISKDLRKKGMKFVGPTIMYAYMQSIGMVVDHLEGCWKFKA